MAQKRIGGKLHLKVAGVVMLARGSFNYSPGGFASETVVGLDGIHGTIDKPFPGFIEGELSDDGSVDVKALQGARDVTVSLALNNGKTVVGTGMSLVGELAVNADEGSMPFRFEGDVEEIL